MEEAVEDQVPGNLALVNGRHVPDEEIAQHSKWGRQNDPVWKRYMTLVKVQKVTYLEKEKKIWTLLKTDDGH